MKKILSVLVVVAVMLTFTLTVSAQSKAPSSLNGVYTMRDVGEGLSYGGPGEVHTVDNFRMVISEETVEFSFYAAGVFYSEKLNLNSQNSDTSHPGSLSVFYADDSKSIDLSLGKGYIYFYAGEFYMDEYGGGLSVYNNSGESYSLELWALTKIQDPQQATAPFAGEAVSDRGDYNLAIDGTIDMVLKEGKNVLTLDQIKTQNIKIVGTNNATGATRTMNQSTLEKMEIFVDNGEIKMITLTGRAQIGTGGKLDRYSVVISL